MNAIMNEKGRQTKLLAAIAIIAMVVCVFAVVMPSDNVEAKVTQDAGSDIFDFTKSDITYGNYGSLDNDDLAQDLTVVYNENTKTFTVTGMLIYQAFDQSGAFESMWTDNTEYHYGLAFQISINEGSTISYGEKTATADSTGIQFLQYISPEGADSVKITVAAADGATEPKAGTYTVDWSGVTFKIDLSKTGVAGSEDENWTYSANTLALNNYTGSEIFYHNGALKITLSGANTITANAPKTTTNNAIIGAATSVTIEMAADTTGSLTINQQADTGFGISAPTVTIGSSTADDTKLSLTVTDGGNRAIYGFSAITIQNANVNVAASEKAIRGGSLTVINSTVVANIIEGSPDVNSQGVDDIWGIKTNGAINIGAGSKVTTDGFRIDTVTIATINGIVIIDGDYQQSAGADLVSNITGLYVDNLNFSTALTAVRGEPASTVTSGIYLINDAAVYGNVQVQNASGTTVDKTLTSVSDVQTTLNETTTESVTLIVPTDAGLTGLNVTSVPDGTVFAINATTGPISGTLTLNGSSVTLTNVKGYIVISEGSVKIDGEEISGEIADVNGTVRLSGSTAAGETLKITKAEGAETARVIVEGNLTITSSSSRQKRRDQEAMDASGFSFFRTASASSGSFARPPPLTASIITTFFPCLRIAS